MRLKQAWEKKLLITQKSIEGLENPDVFKSIADRQAKVHGVVPLSSSNKAATAGAADGHGAVRLARSHG